MSWLDVMNATLIGILLSWPSCSACPTLFHFSPSCSPSPALSFYGCLQSLPFQTFHDSSMKTQKVNPGIISFSSLRCAPFFLVSSANYSRLIMPFLFTAGNDSIHFYLLLVLLFVANVIGCSLDTSDNLVTYHIILNCYLTSWGFSCLIYEAKKLD